MSYQVVTYEISICFCKPTLRADDSRCKLWHRSLAADRFVMLAVAQRHLVSRALHTAHDHICHVTAVPVPGFLRWGHAIANGQTCEEKQSTDQKIII